MGHGRIGAWVADVGFSWGQGFSFCGGRTLIETWTYVGMGPGGDKALHWAELVKEWGLVWVFGPEVEIQWGWDLMAGVGHGKGWELAVRSGFTAGLLLL